MKKTCYKVVYPGIRYIPDINAIYSAVDKTKQGIIQNLSATLNEYLCEEYAIADEFQKSLKGGLLRKWIDEGKIVEELVEDTKPTKSFDPYTQKPMEIEEDNDISLYQNSENTVKKAVIDRPSPTINWDTLTIEEKRTLMRNEELDAKKKEEAVDWIKLTIEEKRALMAKEEEMEMKAKSEQLKKLIVKNYNKKVSDRKNSVVKQKKLKVSKPKKANKGDIVAGTAYGVNVVGKVVVEPNAVGTAVVDTIDTYDKFERLKYQEKLTYISNSTDKNLLNEIMEKSKVDMLIVRSMKKIRELK